MFFERYRYVIYCLQEVKRIFNYGPNEKNVICKAYARLIGCAQRTSRMKDDGSHWYHIVCSGAADKYFEEKAGQPCSACEYQEDKDMGPGKGCSEKYKNLCGINELLVTEGVLTQPFPLIGEQQDVYDSFGGKCKDTQRATVSTTSIDDYDEPTTVITRAPWTAWTWEPRPYKPDRNYRILKMLQRLIPMIQQAVVIAAEKKRKVDEMFEADYGIPNKSYSENYTFDHGTNVGHRVLGVSPSNCVALLLVAFSLIKLFWFKLRR